MGNEEYIQELIERDKPYPMGRFIVPSGALKGTQIDACGKCGDALIFDAIEFCPYCGQRVDHTLYKL